MKHASLFVSIVCGFAILIIILPIAVFKKMEIVAEDRLELLGSPDQTSETVGSLAPGTRTWVIGCHDIHHYIVLKVRFDGERIGYIHAGKYQLIRSSSLAAWRAPIAWWCR
jgi:hypothetical protein